MKLDTRAILTRWDPCIEGESWPPEHAEDDIVLLCAEVTRLRRVLAVSWKPVTV